MESAKIRNIIIKKFPFSVSFCCLFIPWGFGMASQYDYFGIYLPKLSFIMQYFQNWYLFAFGFLLRAELCFAER